MDNIMEFNLDLFNFFVVGPVSDLPVGDRHFLEINGIYLIIINLNGEFFAIADLCSHDDGPLGDGSLENHQIICPRHGARFDIRNGKALTLPAVEGIQSYPIRGRDGSLEVGIPKEI
jgi:3-phenylpropionate/trans-cinnamate dioxygenase ferredoxin subunit